VEASYIAIAWWHYPG